LPLAVTKRGRSGFPFGLRGAAPRGDRPGASPLPLWVSVRGWRILDFVNEAPSLPAIPDLGHAPRNWRRHGRELWRLTRVSAKLLGPSTKFLGSTEAHTYAYSVSANMLLAFLPFVLMLVWVSRHLQPLGFVLDVVTQFIQSYLPTGATLLVRDVNSLSTHASAQVFSVVMLAVSSTGVFMPLEVALNGIWEFQKNRGYLANQAVSLGLVAICGAIGFCFLQFTVMGQRIVDVVAPGETWFSHLLDFIVLQTFAFPAAILGFFVIYWLLPNGKVSPARVFPAALYTGILAEIFKTVFRWVLPLLDFRAVYGASLALPVTLLVWGYCGALLLLFGASLSARGVAKMPHIHVHLRRHAEHHAKRGH